MLKNLCPGCMKHCYLDEPRCERGMEYANTGVLPPRKPRPDGGHGGGKHSERKMKYLALDREGKLALCLRELGSAAAELEGEELNALFDCLRDAERADLLMLLEKIRHGWLHRTREQG